MMPKEKAKELYSKFWKIIPQPYTENSILFNNKELKFNDWEKEWTNSLAKECCLLFVKEMLDSAGFIWEYWCSRSYYYKYS